jgi:histidinol phosphatase-like PHP family hydrolase
MIDLHTHTLMSDGVLLPAEMVRRASVVGCRFVALTDHADLSVLEQMVPRVAELCRDLNRRWEIRALPGVELTHNPPEDIARLAYRARELGAGVVVVHGETMVEPVPPGTNRAAILAGVDILAHPGFITREECLLAAQHGVALEVTTRKGHCYTNGHVVRMARETGAGLVIDTDAHEPQDLVDRRRAGLVARGAGMDDDEVERAFRLAEQIAAAALARLA